jgi:phosphoglycolate phosphatase-like HAD superfamily hydrolase
MKKPSELTALSLQELKQHVEAKGTFPHANKVLILDFDDVLYTVSVPAGETYRPRKRTEYPSYLIGGDLTKAALKQLKDEGVSLCIAMKKTKDEAEHAFAKLKESGISDYFQFVVYDDRFVPDQKLEVLTACRNAYTPNPDDKSIQILMLDSNKSILETAMLSRVVTAGATMEYPNDFQKKAEILVKTFANVKEYYAKATMPVSAPTHTPVEPTTPTVGTSDASTASLEQSVNTEPTSHESNAGQPQTNVKPKKQKLPWRWRYLAVFGFDGYDPLTKTITCADTGEFDVLFNYPIGWPLLASFLGLPSRPAVTTDQKGKVIPYLTLGQFFKNFIGGFDWSEKTSGTKKVLQILAMPIKLFIILPLKLITFPFKFFINILKLLVLKLPSDVVLLLITLMGPAWKTLIASRRSRLVIALPGIILAVLSFSMIAFGFAAIALYFISLPILSPQLSARKAFDNGRKFKEFLFGTQGGEFFANIVGAIGAFISLTLTAFAWAILLPLAFSAVITMIPALAPALLATITWISHLPLIASALGVVNGAFATLTTSALALTLNTLFAPIITTLATLLGIHVPATILALGATLSIATAFIATPLSRIADILSDRWAIWTQTKAPSSEKNLGSNKEEIELDQTADFSDEAASLLKNNQLELDNAARSEETALKSALKATLADDGTETNKTPMQPAASNSSNRLDTDPNTRSHDFN